MDIPKVGSYVRFLRGDERGAVERVHSVGKMRGQGDALYVYTDFAVVRLDSGWIEPVSATATGELHTARLMTHHDDGTPYEIGRFVSSDLAYRIADKHNGIVLPHGATQFWVESL